MAADDECRSQVLASGEIVATAAGHESFDACSSDRLLCYLSQYMYTEDKECSGGRLAVKLLWLLVLKTSRFYLNEYSLYLEICTFDKNEYSLSTHIIYV